ncbi:Aldo/keto reductase [Epithele typhae]|uniref:Aldo/keto reductase n=1 Tax=Epithele typhae TaxID=378194 RepID=UPI002008C80E|nr:Aldo/keto reductase [Epithele typhae]KAH9919462.1 Aldo/keto reductase [Epithele typhae]
MPWDLIKLNDGASIPSIAYGTWTLGNGDQATGHVDEAINVGFSHVDTAQSYRNEVEAGKAIKDSGLSRKDIFITTKYSGVDGLDIETSIQNSLDKLGVKYVDLYLIHHPRLAQPDIPTAWAKMEKLKDDGLVKSIGVSNFGVTELQTLINSAKVLPAANQILLHPYVYERQKEIIEFGNKHAGGPVDKPLQSIADRLNAKPEQVLLAWAKAKGVVVVTSSSKKERMEGYLDAGDLALTVEDIEAIDEAGAKGMRQMSARTFVRRVAVVALAAAAGFGACSFLGIDLL